MNFDLESARIKSLPEDAFYIADFITEDEEEMLLQKVGTECTPYNRPNCLPPASWQSYHYHLKSWMQYSRLDQIIYYLLSIYIYS